MDTTEERRAETLARPSAAQYEWQDMELGLIIGWVPKLNWEAFEKTGAEPWDLELQKAAAATIRADEYDPAQWVRSAKELGAKYMVVGLNGPMGLHGWRSEYGALNFAYSRYPADDPRGDPLGTLAKECRKEGIRLGVYMTGRTECFGAVDGGITKDPARQEEYTKLYRGWITEILSKYGEIAELWFDGSLVLEIGDLIKKYAPNAIIFQSKFANIRWVGQEQGYASDPAWNSLSRLDGVTGVATQRHGDPDGDCWMPLECDAKLRKKNWCYNMGSDNPLRPLEELMEMYYNSVGHGANLLINHAVAPNGRIPEEDMQRMKEFGEEIRRRFGHPIAVGSGEGETVELDLGGKHTVDHVVTMEEISEGERIRAYVIEGWNGSEWIRLTGGIAVGHKRIDYFKPFETDKIRIRALRHVGTPIIRSISAHCVGVTPKIPEPIVYDEVRVFEYGDELFDIVTNEAEFTFALDPFTPEAGQYHVSFRDWEGAAPLVVTDAWLTVRGVKMEQYVERGEDNEFNVFAPGKGVDMVFHAKIPPIDGRVKGSVYYYRMT